MTEIHEDEVDIPEPDRALPPRRDDTSLLDPGDDAPALDDAQPALGEDPSYDPGGMGHQPDIAEDEELHP